MKRKIKKKVIYSYQRNLKDFVTQVIIFVLEINLLICKY